MKGNKIVYKRTPKRCRAKNCYSGQGVNRHSNAGPPCATWREGQLTSMLNTLSGSLNLYLNLSWNFGSSMELRISAIWVYLFPLLIDLCLYFYIATTRISLIKRSSCSSVHSNGDLFTNNKKSRAEIRQWCVCLMIFWTAINSKVKSISKFESQKNKTIKRKQYLFFRNIYPKFRCQYLAIQKVRQSLMMCQQKQTLVSLVMFEVKRPTGIPSFTIWLFDSMIEHIRLFVKR